MKCNETGVLKKSEVYFSTPSQIAKKIYFYPISAGHFFCVKGYHLVRKNYNSLLITHILDGSFTYIKDGKHITAHKGDTIIIDCYKPHEYFTNDSFESVWVHIAGANSYEIFNNNVAPRSCHHGYNSYLSIKLYPTVHCRRIFYLLYLLLYHSYTKRKKSFKRIYT